MLASTAGAASGGGAILVSIVVGAVCSQECCFGGRLRTDKAIQVRFILLTGVLFWRSTPNRQCLASQLYVVDRSAVLEVDSEQTRPFMLAFSC